MTDPEHLACLLIAMFCKSYQTLHELSHFETVICKSKSSAPLGRTPRSDLMLERSMVFETHVSLSASPVSSCISVVGLLEIQAEVNVTNKKVSCWCLCDICLCDFKNKKPKLSEVCDWEEIMREAVLALCLSSMNVTSI